MSKKTYNLIEYIATGIEAIGIGIVVYIGANWSTPTAIAIPIAKEAICSICKLFVKDEK